MIKIVSVLYYYAHSLIYHYLPPDQQIKITRVINKMVSILRDSFVLFMF